MLHLSVRSLKALSVITAVLSLLVTLFLFYPGFMSTDSFVQLQEARSGVYSGFHPPLMGVIWGWFDAIIPGPFGMLLFHAAMYWLSVFLLIRLLFPLTILTPFLILLVGFFPPLFAVLSTVWKDVSLGTSLFLAFAFLLYGEMKKPNWKWTLLLTQPLLFYALSVRHNAAPAVFSFELWFATILIRDFKLKRYQRVSYSLCIFMAGTLVFFGLSSAVTNYLVHQKLSSQGSMILYHDLIGISVRTGKQYLPEFTFPGDEKYLEPVDLEPVYTPSSIDMAYKDLGGNQGRKLKGVDEGWKFTPMLQAWWKAVHENPLTYLRHRTDLFVANVLNFRHRTIFAFMTAVPENSLGVSSAQPRYQYYLMAIFWRLSQTFLFHGYLYVPLLLFLSFVFWRSSREEKFSAYKKAILFTGLSAWSYLLPYFFVSVDHDFRYIWWSVIATLICVVLFIADHIQKRLHNYSQSKVPSYVYDELDPKRSHLYEPITKGLFYSLFILSFLVVVAPFYLIYRKALQILWRGKEVST